MFRSGRCEPGDDARRSSSDLDRPFTRKDMLAVDPVKHFDLVFGGIFAVIGMVALITGAVLCVVLTC